MGVVSNYQPVPMPGDFQTAQMQTGLSRSMPFEFRRLSVNDTSNLLQSLSDFAKFGIRKRVAI